MFIIYHIYIYICVYMYIYIYRYNIRIQSLYIGDCHIYSVCIPSDLSGYLVPKLQSRNPRWPEAGLEEAMVYLRMSALLQIPETFKGLIPKFVGKYS